MHPYSSMAFQRYQEHGWKQHGLGDLNMKKKKKQNIQNKKPTLVNG
jgi:hypothetical protein